LADLAFGLGSPVLLVTVEKLFLLVVIARVPALNLALEVGAALGEVLFKLGVVDRDLWTLVGADEVEQVSGVFVVQPLAVISETASEHVGLADVIVLGLHAEGDELDRE